MSINDLPPWAQAEVRRVLRGEARRLLALRIAAARQRGAARLDDAATASDVDALKREADQGALGGDE